MMYYEDINLDKLICPTREELTRRENVSTPFINCIIGVIKRSINKCEEITVSENDFSQIDKLFVFSKVMCILGTTFADNPDIEVDYQKPEINGIVIPKVVVKNIKLREENKQRKIEIGELNNKINALTKQIKKGSDN